MADQANVIIVGSGVAGSLVANLLIKAGVGGIVMLDAGPNVAMQDPRSWFDLITANKLPYGDLYDTTEDYVSAGANPWQISGGRLFGRGGSTIHWGGWTPRFMPEDFQLFTNTGQGIDWPYTYADLEPYYGQAEIYVGVAGVAVQGQRDWRSTPFPMVAATLPLTAQPIVTAMDALGISYQHMPMARNTVTYNGHQQCLTTGTCDYCPVGARFTGDQPLDSLSSVQQFQLILGAPATEILMNSKTEAAGVRYTDRASGESKEITASAVFLCAGAWEVPKLMLASTGLYWPSGIGNDAGLVGRYLVANPYLYCRGYSDTNPQKLQQELNFPNLCSRYWDSPAEQANGKFLMNMSYGAPELHPATMMYGGSTAAEIAAATTGKVSYELQGALAPFPNYDNQVMLASGTTRFGLPRTSFFTPTTMVPAATQTLNENRMAQIFTKMGYTVTGSGAYPQRGDHSASTCRMATSDSVGVVDPTLKVFGTDNLYVASNAALPTIGAANVTLTMVAAVIKAVEEILAANPPWKTT